MAIFAYTNVKVVFNAIDFSDHCTSAMLKVGAKELDATAFSSTGWEAFIAGLKGWTLDLELNDDMAVGSIDATLYAALVAGTAVAVTFKPVNATTTTSNPEWQGNVAAAYEVTVGGKVGDLATTRVTLKGTGALTRATS